MNKKSSRTKLYQKPSNQHAKTAQQKKQKGQLAAHVL